MKEFKGFTLMQKGNFLTKPIEVFGKKKDAQDHAKNMASDLGENWKDYQIVKCEVSVNSSQA